MTHPHKCQHHSEINCFSQLIGLFIDSCFALEWMFFFPPSTFFASAPESDLGKKIFANLQIRYRFDLAPLLTCSPLNYLYHLSFLWSFAWILFDYCFNFESKKRDFYTKSLVMGLSSSNVYRSLQFSFWFLKVLSLLLSVLKILLSNSHRQNHIYPSSSSSLFFSL